MAECKRCYINVKNTELSLRFPGKMKWNYDSYTIYGLDGMIITNLPKGVDWDSGDIIYEDEGVVISI